MELTEKINEVEKNLKKSNATLSDLGKTVARTDYMLKFIIGLLLVALGVLSELPLSINIVADPPKGGPVRQ